MVKPQLGHDQVVSEYWWSLNTGGHKSRFHCIMVKRLALSLVLFLCAGCFLCIPAPIKRGVGDETKGRGTLRVY